MLNKYSIARKLGENRYKVRADRDMPIILQTTVMRHIGKSVGGFGFLTTSGLFLMRAIHKS